MPALQCGAGARPMLDERVYFGTLRPGGVVSEADWAAFVDDTVATRFPAGFSTWAAAGAWRGADGVLVREDSHVLSVVRPAGVEGDAKIAAVMAAYRTRFEQEAVLRVTTPACAGF